MKITTAIESRNLDRRAEAANVSIELLMEVAGVVAARELLIKYRPELGSGPCTIVCGPGMNGGDGLVMARHLSAFCSELKQQLNVIIQSSSLNRESPVGSQLQRLKNGFPVKIVSSNSTTVPALLAESRVIVDALFGTGLARNVTGTYAKIIEHMNASKAVRVALDIPSGLDATTGWILGSCVRADCTLTFETLKTGLMLNDGRDVAGGVKVLKIGLAPDWVRIEAKTARILTAKVVKRLMPARKENQNKYSKGRLAILAGGPSMWGAGLICARAAVRAGAGHVTWLSEEVPPPSESLKAPEIITGSFSQTKNWSDFSSLVVGPGLASSQKIPWDLISELQDCRGVLDASAMLMLKTHRFAEPENWVITPHAGELAQLMDVESAVVAKDRMMWAQRAVERFGCHVLLKGPGTIVASPKRALVIIREGNSGLAKAGSGDVLAGVIGALMLEIRDARVAASLGAYLHGKASELWVSHGENQRSLTPTDLADQIKDVLARI